MKTNKNQLKKANTSLAHELNECKSTLEESNDIRDRCRIIIEQRVKVNQKARILELKRRNHKDYCSVILYAISIKEDIGYLCPELHSASMMERSIRRIHMKPYAVFKYKLWNILEYNNPGAHTKRPQYAVVHDQEFEQNARYTVRRTKLSITFNKEALKTISLDYSSLPEFDLFSDLKDQYEEEVIEAMTEPTMEEYMMKT
ncbi:hypothetical protein Tco_0394209 [Tanacetum coccineum]